MEAAYYKHYWSKGWVAVESVYSAAEMESIAAAPMACTPETWGSLPRKIDRPFLKGSQFRKLVMDPRLISLIERLIGVPPVPVADQIFMKPPRFGIAKPYHQDNFYFRCTPAGHVMTAWIALDDATLANGCLRYIDGSHLGPLLPHEPVPGQPFDNAPPAGCIDVSRESQAEVGKGGVIFHHSMTLHASGRNESDTWRRGYATHWASRETVSESAFLDAGYFHRADFPDLISA
jgi:phytanoyl-CoA hydroxylase